MCQTLARQRCSSSFSTMGSCWRNLYYNLYPKHGCQNWPPCPSTCPTLPCHEFKHWLYNRGQRNQRRNMTLHGIARPVRNRRLWFPIPFVHCCPVPGSTGRALLQTPCKSTQPRGNLMTDRLPGSPILHILPGIPSQPGQTAPRAKASKEHNLQGWSACIPRPMHLCTQPALLHAYFSTG